MRYAQILDGKVHWVFESDAQPDFANNIVIVSLNGRDDIQEDWRYDDGIFMPLIAPPAPTPTKGILELAEEIQLKQARDTLVKFDVLATVFEDLEKNDVIKFEVLATIFETLMELQDKIDNL